MKRRVNICILIGLLTFPCLATASEVYKPCDVEQGFYLEPDKNTRIGFITYLKIGSIPELKPDLVIYNPEDPSQQLPIFAVLQNASWGLRPATPIQFFGQISDDNQRVIGSALTGELPKIDVQFQFVIYDFNRTTGLYYKSFHSNSVEMRGQIENNEKGINLSVGDKPWHKVERPENYAFSISISPTQLAQIVFFSLGPGKEINRPWRAKSRY